MAFNWNNPPPANHIDSCDVANEPVFDLHVTDLQVPADAPAVMVAVELSRAIAIGDGLRVFDARDELVRRWSAGKLSFNHPAIDAALFCALKDRTEMTLQERQALTATVFGFPISGLPPGTRRNEQFGALFTMLLDVLVRRARRNRVSAALETATAEAARLVHRNLTQVVEDVVFMRMKEIARRARIDLDILLFDNVLLRLSPRRQLWEVIAELVPGAGSATEYSEQLTMAQSRSAVLELVAAGDPNAAGNAGQLRNAMDAAVVLRELSAARQAPPAALSPSPAAALDGGQGDSSADDLTLRRQMSLLTANMR